MALGDSLTIGSEIFARLKDGNYISEASTVDEPHTLEIKSTVKADAESSYLVKFTRSENADGSGLLLPDKPLSLHTVIRGDMKFYSQAQVEYEWELLKTFLTPSVFTRILRGEL